MKNILYIDFETRSACDLKKAGSHLYAKHETTELICLAYSFNDGEVLLIEKGDRLPIEAANHVRLGGIVVGHNIYQFERLIWNYHCVPKYNWPELKVEQCHDTMVMAYAMGLPGSLEKAAASVGITEQKNMVGQRVMLQLSQPRDIEDGKITWWEPFENPEKFETLYDYCKQDVRVERELYKRLAPISKQEMPVVLLDQKINDRGVRIDDKVFAASMVIELAKDKLNAEMQEVTDNYVGSVSAVQSLVEWMKFNGVSTEGVAKENVTQLLLEDLPPKIRRALEIRQEGAKASTAKLDAMIAAMDGDFRVRGMFQYHGASTGRWAGRKIQFQNFPRGALSEDEIEGVFKLLGSYKNNEVIESLEMIYGSVAGTISSCLRGFIVPGPGKKFIAADFASIEARVLAWLAGQEDILKLFRGEGKIYEHTAAQIYNKSPTDISKHERQIGKVASLALGYGGGKAAFQKMAKGYGVKVDDSLAEAIKNKWREANSKIVRYWYSLEEAAMRSIRNPGHKFNAGEPGRTVTYLTKGSFLMCQLPSKRVMFYPYPKIIESEMPWGGSKEGIVYKAEGNVSRKFEETKTYGGSLAENITQAVARDILAEAMLRLDYLNYEIVAHIHDEIVCEVDEDFGDVFELESIMCETPDWADGLPVKAEGWDGNRFKK